MTDNATTPPANNSNQRSLHVGAGAVDLDGTLSLPADARGLVIIPLDNADLQPIVEAFNNDALATFVVPLFTAEEQQLDTETGFFRQNTEIMQQRLIAMADWFLQNDETQNLTVGYFGIGVTATAALIAAAERPDNVRAVVAIGADKAQAIDHGKDILAPLLLIAAQSDQQQVRSDQEFLNTVSGNKQLEMLQGNDPLFKDEQSVKDITRLASSWFTRWLEPIV